eukprot:9127834-Alexandrium_andersonii.AAC.1
MAARCRLHRAPRPGRGPAERRWRRRLRRHGPPEGAQAPQSARPRPARLPRGHPLRWPAHAAEAPTRRLQRARHARAR